MGTKNNRVCPVEASGSLNSPLRKWIQHPRKILYPYIKPGMTVVDLGCGPGFFTIEMAKMVKLNGKLFAVDLQEGMLEKVKQNMDSLSNIIQLHQCSTDRIGLNEKADFILAFYMIHEVPDKERLYEEIKTILKPGGKLFIAEPNFHVSKKAFNKMIFDLEALGFEKIDTPRVFFSRAIVLRNNR